MHTRKLKQKAIELRKSGYSYNYINKLVPVSKSTLSLWLRNIPFKPNELTKTIIKNANLASGNNRRQVKENSIKEATTKAKKIINILSERDLLMLGIGVYIGEGAKTNDITRITNSDIRIIKFAIKWFQKCFDAKLKNFKIRLHIYPDNNELECIEYWSKKTGLPKNQFFKSTIDPRLNKKNSNRKKLPYGTAHLTVFGFGEKKFGVELNRLIIALINKVLC